MLYKYINEVYQKKIDIKERKCYYVYIIDIYTLYTLKRGDTLNVNISNTSTIPLYEQIQTQIKSQILNGNLKSGEGLPSIRNLAKELKVSIITTKRAYEELEKEGFIETVTGKGTFVSKQNTERLKEITLYDIENKLEEIIKQAKAVGVTLEEGIEIFKSIYEEV